VWKIIKGWLDPVVASKIHFVDTVGGLCQYIEPSNLVKELGGQEDWEYKYVEPQEGENRLMDDTTTREKILAERRDIVSKFDNATMEWLNADPGDKETRQMRTEIAKELRTNYWRLDPYIRARSVYDRCGHIGPCGGFKYSN